MNTVPQGYLIQEALLLVSLFQTGSPVADSCQICCLVEEDTELLTLPLVPPKSCD